MPCARLGISAKGKKYIHVGRYGLYHRQEVGAPGAPGAGGLILRIFIVGILLAILLLAVVTARGSDRLHEFNQDGNRRGYAKADEQAGRIDRFDARPNRTGYGIQRPDGPWDLFSRDGSRLGGMHPGPGGHLPRLFLRPLKR